MHGMDRMVRIMARAVGNDLPAVIRMASLTPAKLTGMDRDIGSIEVGKRADFAVLTPELNVTRVYIGGPMFAARSSEASLTNSAAGPLPASA
jgi:N-acetylglucosamine-6-phosphate deacetylase